MNRFVFLLPLFLLCLTLSAWCQDTTLQSKPESAMYVSATANTGWVWKHRKSITGLPDAYPNGIELNIGWQTTGKKPWHQLHNYPRWGFKILYLNLDNPTQLGHLLHLAAYMDFYALKRPRHELYCKIGTGIGFYNKYYHITENPNNTLISLPMSMSVMFSFNYRFIATERWSFILGFNFNHGSNGSLRQPNLGINIPSVQFGTHYVLQPQRMTYTKQELPEYKKKFGWWTNLSVSTKQSASEPLNDVNYMAYTLSSYVTKRFTRKSIALVGMDGCWDESIKYTERTNPDYIADKYPIYRFAATLGYEFVLTEKTHVLMQNAFYLYDPYQLDVPVYQRYGFKFLPFKHAYAAYYLKTHLGKADFWEFALGFRI
jgi:hypothetical protein